LPLALSVLLLPVAARAEDARAIDLPASTLSDAVARLGRQAGVSISVADASLWRSRVQPVRGRMRAREALDRMLAGTQARAVPAGDAGWRIVRREAPRPPARRAPPPAPPPPAVDEPAPAEIIVTASKRDTPIGRFAGLVSVLNGADLAFGGARGTEAVLARLSGVASTHLGAGRNKLFIRGIADSSFTGPTQATVGQYVGDVRLSYNAPDPDLRLYDISSVEVLEGPQGTLYGAGSMGGIIRIVPAAPDPSAFRLAAAGGASLTWHGDPGADLGGMVNLPLGGGNALRLVGYGIEDGGYIDNPVLGRRDINRTRTAGGRATLRLDPGDGWIVDLGGIAQGIDAADSQYADREAPRLIRNSRVREGAEAEYRLGTLVLSKRWDGGLRFQSSNAVARHHLEERFDASVPEGAPRLFDQDNRTRMFASENRLWMPVTDGFGWVLGGSLLDNRVRLARRFGPANERAALTGVTNRVREATLFGEASVALFPDIVATAGARFTTTRLSGAGEDVPLAVAALYRGITAQRRERDLLPSFGLLATPAPDLAVFVRYQQGFRPGGLSIETDFVRRFRSDSIATIEAGARYGLPARGPIDATLSVSHSRWRDIQADFVDGAGFPSTANIGDGRITSLSGTVAIRPGGGWSFDLGATYNHSRVTDLAPELLFAAAGRLGRIPNVARFALRTGLDYRAAVSDAVDLRINGWANYVGPSRLGIGPVLGEGQGDYVDTGLVARIGDAGRGVSLTLTNLLDNVGNRFALGTPFVAGRADFLTPMRPRTIRLGFDLAY
jgi:outer membrane receptor protein involved in Fe transport